MSTTERAQSDFKKLKSKYNSQLSTLKELFTEWTEEDLLFTLQDADGDLELAIDRISEGHASQWGEVKTKKSKKEAAAANKATLEVSASSTTSTAPSYPSSSSYNNNTRAPSNRTSTNAKRLSPAVSQPRHKPTSATWQQQPTKKTTDDNNNWKSTDNWSSNDSWSTQTKDPIVETPKKISTPSSSTKTSNGGGAKTWASLLQSKPEPVVVAEPIEEPQLRKVDDSWLPSSSDLNQWDQPLQLPTTENVQEQVQKEEKQEKEENPITEKEQSPIISHITTATTTTTTATETIVTAATATNLIEKDQDISVDFSSLTLQDTIVENTSSSHPSVADLLNSVKQQPSISNTTATSSTTTQPIDSLTQQQLYQQQQQQLYQQQQQQQQQQYQQFGIQDYGHTFNSNYGANTNYYAQEEKTPDVTATTTTASSNSSASTGQQYPQQNMYGQPPQQSFYPYYYMPNQFNAYSPYGQQGANSFVNNTRNNMYPTSVYGQQKTTTPSPYLNSSPYNQSQQLYSGFNQFDQFYNNSPQAAATTIAAESPDKTNVTKSPQNPSQQAYSSNYFSQSPMFGYQQQQQQQQQPYRGTGNTNQYWNQ